MKKILSMILTLSMLLCSFGTTNAFAVSSVTQGNITFTFENGVLTISGNGNMPQNNEKYGSRYRGFVKKEDIKKIIINEGITSIGEDEFFLCENLTDISIPNSVIEIGEFFIGFCKNLKKISLPDGLTKICDHAFSLSYIEEVILPNNLKTIGESAFNCTDISNLKIPSSVTDIGNEAFKNCSGLSCVDFVGSNSDTITIGDGAFEGCYNLRTFNAPQNVKYGYCVFGDCTQKINGIESVMLYTLDGRTRLTPAPDVEAYKKVGWYTEPVRTLYTLDGRSQVFKQSEVPAQLMVGWYEYPVVMMYAIDGRTAIVYEKDIVANEKVGWYYGKPVTMYSADGRTLIVGENRVEEQKSVGWYTEPVVKMYAVENGNLKIITVLKSQVAANKKVGWRTDMPKSKQVTGECPSCYGKGSYDCTKCYGKGYTMEFDGLYSVDRSKFHFYNTSLIEGMPKYKRVNCTRCNSRGTENCSTCKGKGKCAKTVYYY